MAVQFPEIPVIALECGRVRVRPHNIAGDGTPMLWWTLTSRTWTGWLPVNAFLVRHPRGDLLFDTGQSPRSLEPGYYPGGLIGWVFRRQAAFEVGEGDELAVRLAEAGAGLDSIAFAAISHLHQDHAGNLALLGGTPVLISASEHALLSERNPAMHGVLTEQLGDPNYAPVAFAPSSDPVLAAFEGAYDVHGDGSLVLLPTPGHSPGSMSLLVRRAGAAPLLLVGDAAYEPALLLEDVVPDVGDRAAQLETARRIRALGEAVPGLRIAAAHDPAAASLVA